MTGNVNSSIKIETYTSAGITADYMIDKSGDYDLVRKNFSWFDVDVPAIRTVAGVLKTKNLSLKQSNQKFRTTLTLDVYLPFYVYDLNDPIKEKYIYKNFHVTD